MAAIPAAGVLLWACVTLEGHVFAIAALALGIAPVLWSFGCGSANRWLGRSAMGLLALWFLLTCWLVWRRPNGHPLTTARVSNHYSDDGWHYDSAALGALLPEVDQFMMGFKLMPAVDPYFTRQQSGSVSPLTRAIYAELEADADFHALGSVMPGAYRELRGQAFDHGHYFFYRSPKLDKSKPVPALVFLHGSGGNFKAYLWLLSRIADELGMVVIAPSYGMGNWDRENGTRAVIKALEAAGKLATLDPSNIHLMGLSNGGLGVSRTAAIAEGRRFASLIFLSPVFDQVAIQSDSFAAYSKDKPVLVITGDDDERVPLSFVRESAALMEAAGAKVETATLDGADHFMLFSHREAVISKITPWLFARIREPHRPAE
jgi:pimeloyl-ACP methyl ester carboxylesterase